MDCEYELRCKNNTKCYRCFDHSLLKLPQDKVGSKKNKVHNPKVANADDSWKDLEDDVAASLNRIPTIQEARRSRASGALWFEKGDIVDDILHPECKERLGRELKSGEKSISLQREWLEKAKDECKYSGKIMCLPFRFKGDTQVYTILEMEDISELVTTMKSYMIDNDAKAVEIDILNKKIKAYEEQLRRKRNGT